MKLAPSEDILIKRILDALSESGKTSLGIAHFIKAKYYRIETTHEINKVIRKYLLGQKVLYEPYFEVYKLNSKSDFSSSRGSDNKGLDQKFEIPKNLQFLNELYKRRQDLLRLPMEERIGNKRLEIIETNTEIECLKPIAIDNLAKLKPNERVEVLKLLFPGLKSELEKIKFPNDDNTISDLNDDSDHLLEDEKESIQKTESENEPYDESINFEFSINFNDSVDSSFDDNENEIISNESLNHKIHDEQKRNVNPDAQLTVEQAINLIIEEKTRLGTLEGNLLAENIIFRLKKGKWG